MCCLDYLDWLCDWIPLRILYKLLRFWWRLGMVGKSNHLVSTQDKPPMSVSWLIKSAVIISMVWSVSFLISPCSLFTGADFQCHSGNLKVNQEGPKFREPRWRSKPLHLLKPLFSVITCRRGKRTWKEKTYFWKLCPGCSILCFTFHWLELIYVKESWEMLSSCVHSLERKHKLNGLYIDPREHRNNICEDKWEKTHSSQNLEKIQNHAGLKINWDIFIPLDLMKRWKETNYSKHENRTTSLSAK